MKKYKRVGISLGGGGGKGAYQIGVLKALHEYDLDRKLTAIAGTSIGALNIATYLTDLEQGERLWDAVDRKEILTRNRSIRFRNFGIYSREGTEKIINSNVDLNRISQIKKPHIYVTATRVKSNRQATFLINGKDPDFIMACLKASSAIPGIFERIEINGELYTDGGLKENIPLKCLVNEEKCDLIYAIPLTGMHEPTIDTYPNTTIINFKTRNYDAVSLWKGVLGFNGTIAKRRIAEGYKVGKDMIHHLMEIGVLPLHRRAPLGVKKRHKVYLKSGDRPPHKNLYVVADIPLYEKEYAKKRISLLNRLSGKALNAMFKRKDDDTDLIK